MVTTVSCSWGIYTDLVLVSANAHVHICFNTRHLSIQPGHCSTPAFRARLMTTTDRQIDAVLNHRFLCDRNHPFRTAHARGVPARVDKLPFTDWGF